MFVSWSLVGRIENTYIHNKNNNNVTNVNRPQAWEANAPRKPENQRGNYNMGNRPNDSVGWRRNREQYQGNNRNRQWNDRQYVSEPGTSNQNRPLREEPRTERRSPDRDGEDQNRTAQGARETNAACVRGQ